MFSKKDFYRKLDKQIKQKEEVHKATRHSLDPLKGWTEIELEAYRHSKPHVVEESKLARTVQKHRDRELFNEKRAIADIKVRTQYPDALDPNSQLSQLIEKQMDDHDLRGNANGRLIAAKLAQIELENNQD